MIEIIITYGALTALLLTAVILASLYVNPRIWMQDLPKEVQKTIPPKSAKEKKQTLIVLVLFLIILLTIPTLAVMNYPLQLTITQALIISYSVYFIFNLTDLLLIDWLIVCTWTPDFIKSEGVATEVYKNYPKHFKDFLKGTGIILLPAVCSGLLGYYLAG